MDTKKITPLVVVVGETASGKSALGIELAKKFNGEIIAADSRTVYKYMDIGTAKPSLEDRKKVRHHLIDIRTPDKPLTVADFKELCQNAIDEISSRGRLPIMVGGSGLYIDSVIFDYKFSSNSVDPEQRNELQKLSVTELQETVDRMELAMPLNRNNKRHLIRQIETGGVSSQSLKIRPNTLVIGLLKDRDILKEDIAKRVEVMFKSGLVEEALSLGGKYGWEAEPLKSIGYREFASYQKDDSIDGIQTNIIRDSINYAKRQKTWFKRNKNIHWISEQIEAVDLVTTLLNK
jgi:tRNA dimethylallyltransferase